MSRQHDRAAKRDIGNVVDKHHALGFKLLDNELVVHDLVVAVHRSREAAHHEGQRLDSHLDASAKTTRLGEQHSINIHPCRLPERSKLAHGSLDGLCPPPLSPSSNQVHLPRWLGYWQATKCFDSTVRCLETSSSGEFWSMKPNSMSISAAAM